MAVAEPNDTHPVEPNNISKSSLDSNLGSQPIQNEAPTQTDGSIESNAPSGPMRDPLYGKKYATALLT